MLALHTWLRNLRGHTRGEVRRGRTWAVSAQGTESPGPLTAWPSPPLLSVTAPSFLVIHGVVCVPEALREGKVDGREGSKGGCLRWRQLGRTLWEVGGLGGGSGEAGQLRGNRGHKDQGDVVGL